MRCVCAAFGVVVALSACVQPSAQVQPRKGATFLPDAQGLAVQPSAQRVDFGRSPKGVIPALTRELGRPAVLPLTGCPTGIAQRMRWGDLELTFTSERFVGWKQGEGQHGRVCT
ncbi:hypothetical protein SAMN04488030_2927 [Aliiroseovarius halocynthiae]|uniref:Uncharacterized protein n=1 Tax=Aliiroseovarius halocynthiae TaxID=985055 RepID=A0A545SNJ0_9RHOB|nr:hypothetical protein [Aliiroseovarius halocynthiae]TQV66558.1 hypothetical protein FIL88_12575 [Aliiroseovarius halocynthiae]SMR82574.1 hypothetical protein SAMN04488030_2927 [Aliiroseovarius halocynthiae]